MKRLQSTSLIVKTDGREFQILSNQIDWIGVAVSFGAWRVDDRWQGIVDQASPLELANGDVDGEDIGA